MNNKSLTFRQKVPLLSVVLFSITLTACYTPVQQKSEIASIEFATGDCYGDCQHTAIYMDSAFSYKYYGGENAHKKGFYNGKVSKALWDTLCKKLYAIHYQQLDTSYEHSVDDQSLELIIRYRNKVKHINAQSSSLPDSVAKVFYWIAKTNRSIKLVPTKDTIKFATRTQTPFRVPILIDSVKFPPPTASQ